MNVRRGKASLLVGAVLALLSLTWAAPAADCNGNLVEDAADIAAGTSADCNADGRPDECDLRDGSIAFDEARVVLAEGQFYSFERVHADLDGDGDIDIAVAGDEVGVIFNRGDGVFGLPVTVTPELFVPGRPWNTIQGADLDGDGDLDLVLTSQHGPEVPILVNDGAGGFTVAQVALLPGDSTGPALADLDGDGDVDIVVLTMSNTDGLRFYNTFAVFENGGSGVFEVALMPSSLHVGRPILADLDGDGFPELGSIYSVYDDALNEYVDGGLDVRRNSGDGSFHEPVSTPLGSPPRQVVVEDFDGDGHPDLAVAVPGLQTVSLLRNEGDGGLEPPLDVPAGGPADRLFAADLDADGDTDVAAWEQGHRNVDSFGTSVLANDGTGGFDSLEISGLNDVHRLGAADLDGDGLLDLMASFYINREPKIEVRRNLGGLAFAEPAFLSVVDAVSGIFAGDLDGDADLDLVAGYPVQTLRNVTGAESFGLGCADFVRGDANADGSVSLSDIVTITRFQHLLLCRDAGDANDDEVADLCDASFIARTLFLGDTQIPAPYPAPAADPTQTPVASSVTGLGCGLALPNARAGCSEYLVEEPIEVGDSVTIGDVFALPGGEVSIPILVSASVPVEGVQLVLEYDPEVLDFGRPQFFRNLWSLDYEGSFYGQFPSDAGGWDAPNLSSFQADPERGVISLGIVGSFWHDGFDIPPGEEILVASMRAAVSPDVAPGTLISIGPAFGSEESGVGPHHLRNELVHRGDARFVSVLPEIRSGVLSIVGDQSYFVRGDSNGDWALDISDPVSTLNTLFLGAPGSACPDADDANDDGKVDISDAIQTLGFLYIGDALMPPPFPAPGVDPSADELRCLRLPRP